MRKALVPAFLLVLGAVVLGATIFREQIVNAATTPFQNVVVTNTPTNPVPVQQTGTSAVSGTVKIDPSGNTVSLNATDSGHLASIDAALGGTVEGLCNQNGDLDADGNNHTLCSTGGTWDISTIVATGMDDAMVLRFLRGSNVELALEGSDLDGTSVYQLNLPRPVAADRIDAVCLNLIENCKFHVSALGTNS